MGVKKEIELHVGRNSLRKIKQGIKILLEREMKEEKKTRKEKGNDRKKGGMKECKEAVKDGGRWVKQRVQSPAWTRALPQRGRISCQPEATQDDITICL